MIIGGREFVRPSGRADGFNSKRTTMTRMISACVWVLVAAGAWWLAVPLWAAEGLAPASQPSTSSAPSEQVILETGRTIWRCYDAWRTDVARAASGELVDVDACFPREQRDEKKGGWAPLRINGCFGTGYGMYAWKAADVRLRPAQHVIGSPYPPAGWQAPDFDDHEWIRARDVTQAEYSMKALACLRGKFEVKDPGQVHGLTLGLLFRGGAVAYLNGQEIGRAALPEGKIGPQTPAQDYPASAYLGADGTLLDQSEVVRNYDTKILAYDAADKAFANASDAAAYKSRFRRLDVKIPSALLRKRVNVLALEIHRSPADPALFTATWPKFKPPAGWLQWSYCLAWNRCEIEDVKLTAAAATDALVPNVAAPKGIQVWNRRPDQPLGPDWQWYGDANEQAGPIRLRGVRNGVYSGQLVVSASDTIQGLKATASALAGPGGKTIPASAAEIGYVILLQNPAAEAQAIDRTHRIGQTRPVMVYRMIARDTIEEKVVALARRKAALFSGVMDQGDLFASSLTAEDIRGLLS